MVAAPIFAGDCYLSGVVFSESRFRSRGVEAELGYRICEDVVAHDQIFHHWNVCDIIDAVVPLVEVVDSRVGDFLSISPFWQLSDNALNGGVVFGEPVENWRDLHHESQDVHMCVNQACSIHQRGWRANENPLDLVAKAVNHAISNGGGIKKGQVIATGSLTGLRFLERGDALLVDFSGLNQKISIQF